MFSEVAEIALVAARLGHFQQLLKTRVILFLNFTRPYTNTLPTSRSRLYPSFKKQTRCHSFMALNRASDVSAADWRSQSHVKNYRNLSRAEIRFFLVVEIPIKHSCLYNKFSFNHIEPKALFKMSLCNKPLIWSSL